MERYRGGIDHGVMSDQRKHGLYLPSFIDVTMNDALMGQLSAIEPKFKVPILAEAGGHHIAFTKAAHRPAGVMTPTDPQDHEKSRL